MYVGVTFLYVTVFWSNICMLVIYLFMLHNKHKNVIVVPHICCSKNPTQCTCVFLWSAVRLDPRHHSGTVSVPAMKSHANEVQLDFSESLKFSTSNYYKTVSGCGDSVHADSSGMFVCVYWGVCVIFVGTVPVWFLTWDSSRHSLEVWFKKLIMTWVKSQPEMECFIRLAWDWDPIHIKWRLKNNKSLMPMLKTSPFNWLNYDVSL